MKKIILLLALAAFVLATTLIYFDKNSENSAPSLTRNSNSPEENSNTNPSERIIENSESFNTENSGGGAEGGGSSGSSSSGTQQVSPGCSLVQISYALKDLEVTPTCTSEECTEKTVRCDLTVQNFDAEFSGTFALRFNFINPNLETLGTTTQSKTVGANQEEIFSVEQTFSSPESSEEISCSFATLEVPKKEVC